MRSEVNIIAFGCSGTMYHSIKYLSEKGYHFSAIITDPVVVQNGVTHEEFRELAKSIKSEFFISRSLNDLNIVELIKNSKVSAAISVNWKYTVPASFLTLFHCGALNFHLGNLPDYKGNATINWSILKGEKFIAGNIHKMVKELDAGDIIVRKKIKIDTDTYVGDIIYAAEQMAPVLFLSALDKVIKNPQTYLIKGTTMGLYCYPRLPEDSQINWNDTTENIHRLIRATSRPLNGAFSYFKGERIIIWKAKVMYPENKFLAIPGHLVKILKNEDSVLVACSDGFLEIQEMGLNGLIVSPTKICYSIRERFKFQYNATN